MTLKLTVKVGHGMWVAVRVGYGLCVAGRVAVRVTVFERRIPFVIARM